LSNYADLPPEKLVRICAAGSDAAAWEEFVRRFNRVIALAVIRVAYQYGEANPDLVEDLVQETYAKLCAEHCKILTSFQSVHEDSIFGFFKVVASNVAADYFRRVRADKRGQGRNHVEIENAEQLASWNSSVEIEQQVLFEDIDRVLRERTSGPNAERDRTIFWLYYRQGLTAASIASLHRASLTVKGVETTILRLTRLVRQFIRTASPLSDEANAAEG